MSALLNDLIAHYIAQNYPLVLPPFIGATGAALPDLAKPPVPDLATLVDDAASAALAEQLAEASLEEEAGMRENDGSWRGWTARDMLKVPLRREAGLHSVTRTIEGVANTSLLTVQVAEVPRRVFDTSTAEYRADSVRSILVASADKILRVVNYETGEVDALLEPHKGPILSVAQHPVNGRYIATGSMDGTTVLSDLVTNATLQTFRAGKFVVRVAFSDDGRWLVAASYDKTVTVFEAVAPAGAAGLPEDERELLLDTLDAGDRADWAADPTLRYAERHRVQLEGNPEALLFADGWLLFTERGSHELQYLRLPGGEGEGGMDLDADGGAAAPAAWSRRTKTFNAHPLDTHVSFSVLDLALHPSGRLLACLTGDHTDPGTTNTSGAGERVLLYAVSPDEPARLRCLWTGSAGDPYTLPRLAWLPDGSGLVTTTPTGHLNLLSLTGERRASLRAHHGDGRGGAGDVVRDLAVVPVPEPGAHCGWEVVSVGYDRRVRISR